MAQSTVRVTGFRETVRAFNALDKSVSKDVKNSLKRAGEPVAADARSSIGRYRGASVRTIRPRVGRAVSVFVTQGAKKVTRKRGDFGQLQMRRIGEALDQNQDQVIASVEDTLDWLSRREGF